MFKGIQTVQVRIKIIQVRKKRSVVVGEVRIQTAQVRIEIIQVRKRIPTLRRGHQVGNRMAQVQQKISDQKKTGRLEKRDTRFMYSTCRAYKI